MGSREVNKLTAEKGQKKQSMVYKAPTMCQACCLMLGAHSVIGFSQEPHQVQFQLGDLR